MATTKKATGAKKSGTQNTKTASKTKTQAEQINEMAETIRILKANQARLIAGQRQHLDATLKGIGKAHKTTRDTVKENADRIIDSLKDKMSGFQYLGAFAIAVGLTVWSYFGAIAHEGFKIGTQIFLVAVTLFMWFCVMAVVMSIWNSFKK